MEIATRAGIKSIDRYPSIGECHNDLETTCSRRRLLHFPRMVLEAADPPPRWTHQEPRLLRRIAMSMIAASGVIRSPGLHTPNHCERPDLYLYSEHGCFAH